MMTVLVLYIFSTFKNLIFNIFHSLTFKSATLIPEFLNLMVLSLDKKEGLHEPEKLTCRVESAPMS